MSNLTFLNNNKEDNSITFNSLNGKLEIYIPNIYFELETAIENGEEIATLGIFEFRYFPDREKDKYEKFELTLPQEISFSFSEQYEISVDSEDDDGVKEKYRVFVLYDNDKFCINYRVPSSHVNVSNLIDIWFSAKIPKMIKYSSILDELLLAAEINKFNYGITACILESMVGELARDPKNINIPFRKTAGKNLNIDEYNFKQVSIKDLALVTSTFSSFCGENVNKILASSIERTRNNRPQGQSAIEKIAKF